MLLQLDNLDGWESIAAVNPPLALYAAEYWIQHVSAGDIASSNELQQPMRALFQPQSVQFINWIQIFNIDRPWHPAQLRRSSSTIAPPRYYASLSGLWGISGWLLDGSMDVNAQGGEYGSMLQVASAGGHEAVVQLLLEKNTDVNAQGRFYGSALQAASADGHEAVVRLLLENNADVNSQGGPYGSALQAASAHGHEAVAQLLEVACVNA